MSLEFTADESVLHSVSQAPNRFACLGDLSFTCWYPLPQHQLIWSSLFARADPRGKVVSVGSHAIRVPLLERRSRRDPPLPCQLRGILPQQIPGQRLKSVRGLVVVRIPKAARICDHHCLEASVPKKGSGQWFSQRFSTHKMIRFDACEHIQRVL